MKRISKPKRVKLMLLSLSLIFLLANLTNVSLLYQDAKAEEPTCYDCILHGEPPNMYYQCDGGFATGGTECQVGPSYYWYVKDCGI